METAIERHDRMWREEREQAERLRSDHRARDHWKPAALTFRPVIDEQGPVADALGRWVNGSTRVIDVGAGGGRFAVPLARRVRELVAVEPSASMRNVLTEAADDHGLQNIEIVASTWEEAEVAPADLVFAAHVTYSVPRIEPFVRKMNRLATQRVAIITFSDPAQHVFAPFWEQVYGEERLRLPVRDELLAVLRELGIDPQIEALQPRLPDTLGTPEQAIDMVRSRLFIGTGTPEEARMLDAMQVLTEVRDGQVWVRDATPNEVSVLSWKPDRL